MRNSMNLTNDSAFAARWVNSAVAASVVYVSFAFVRFYLSSYGRLGPVAAVIHNIKN